MFPEALPVRKLRKCLHCPRMFNSSSAAERVCPKCRRKHNKLLEKYSGVITFESTPQMSAHIRSIEELREESVLPMDKVEAFLLGDNSVDDSAVYLAIKKKERIKKTASVKKTGAVFILEALIKETKNAQPKKRRGSEHIEF